MRVVSFGDGGGGGPDGKGYLVIEGRDCWRSTLVSRRPRVGGRCPLLARFLSQVPASQRFALKQASRGLIHVTLAVVV
jgi:hypothetical protein